MAPSKRLPLLLLLASSAAVFAASEDQHSPTDHDRHSHGITQDEFAAALARGEDPCAATPREDYNLGLHVGSVFILLGVSLLGSLAPVALRISSNASVLSTIVRLGTYFGFGTILATAFIHMMLPAVESLSSPCLPAFWTESYEAWAYLFVTVAILAMHLIDFLIKGRYMGQARGREGMHGHAHARARAHAHAPHGAMVGSLVTADLSASSPANEPGQLDVETASDNGDGGACPVHGEGCNTLLKHEHSAAKLVGIYMTEAGIIFHSVMIGLALGVTGGTAFLTLLVALSFHQFFEGFAIGSAAVDSGVGAWKSAAMGLAYSVSTPIGIAVGIGVYKSFNQNSASYLLATGILDSLAAGILIFVVLVDLVNPMLTESAWLRSQRWWLQVLSFVAFYSGAAVMAVIGKWA